MTTGSDAALLQAAALCQPGEHIGLDFDPEEGTFVAWLAGVEGNWTELSERFNFVGDTASEAYQLLAGAMAKQ